MNKRIKPDHVAELSLLNRIRSNSTRFNTLDTNRVNDVGESVRTLAILSGEVGRKYDAKCERSFVPSPVDVVFIAGKFGWIAIDHEGEFLYATPTYAASLQLIFGGEMSDQLLRAVQCGLPVIYFFEVLDHSIEHGDAAAQSLWAVHRHSLIEGIALFEQANG